MYSLGLAGLGGDAIVGGSALLAWMSRVNSPGPAAVNTSRGWVASRSGSAAGADGETIFPACISRVNSPGWLTAGGSKDWLASRLSGAAGADGGPTFPACIRRVNSPGPPPRGASMDCVAWGGAAGPEG